MSSTNQIAEISALLGDPARASMLAALMDGRALTATELAATAGVTAPTASGHLSQLTSAGLLAVQKQGRHRYHRLASQDVAQTLEGIMQLAAGLTDGSRPDGRPVRIGPRDAELRAARTCYDHLAGRLGVGIADALDAGGHVELTGEGGFVTAKGVALFQSLGIDLAEPKTGARKPSGRVLCRPCLDWSERRPHLAGRLGAALCTHCFERGWIRRIPGKRAVAVTPPGQMMLRETFGLRDV